MTLKLILILSAIVTIEFLVLVIMFLLLKNTKKEKKSLENELKKQQQNLLYLYKHAEEIALIEKDKSKLSKDIKECKNDKEALDIINTIINLNNNRVQDTSKA